MECSTVIKTAREQQMAPLLPWCTAEPCIKLPLTAVLIDGEKVAAYITLADLAKAFESQQ